MARTDMVTYTQCARKAADLLDAARTEHATVAHALTHQASVWIELAKLVKEHGGVR